MLSLFIVLNKFNFGNPGKGMGRKNALLVCYLISTRPVFHLFHYLPPALRAVSPFMKLWYFRYHLSVLCSVCTCVLLYIKTDIFHLPVTNSNFLGGDVTPVENAYTLILVYLNYMCLVRAFIYVSRKHGDTQKTSSTWCLKEMKDFREVNTHATFFLSVPLYFSLLKEVILKWISFFSAF